jgi:hypothetical protein
MYNMYTIAMKAPITLAPEAPDPHLTGDCALEPIRSIRAIPTALVHAPAAGQASRICQKDEQYRDHHHDHDHHLQRTWVTVSSTLAHLLHSYPRYCTVCSRPNTDHAGKYALYLYSWRTIPESWSTRCWRLVSKLELVCTDIHRVFDGRLAITRGVPLTVGVLLGRLVRVFRVRTGDLRTI